MQKISPLHQSSTLPACFSVLDQEECDERFYYACKIKDVNFACSLLGKGANVNRANSQNKHPLHAAVRSSSPSIPWIREVAEARKMVKFLLSQGADVNL